MTSDDPSPPRSWLTDDRTRGLRIALGVSGVLILAALAFYLGRVSAEDPEPIAAPTTEARSSTTTTQSAPTTSGAPPTGGMGEALAWEQVATISGASPFSLVSHDGTLYLFGWAPSSPRDPSPDVMAWTSGDGSTWESLGTVLEGPDAVHSVVSTPLGLVAFSFGESARFFTSSDGSEWNSVELPVETTGSEFLVHAIRGAAANDGTTVVLASTYLDFENMVVDALPDELKTEGEFHPYGMGFGGPPFEVTVQGPLGITVFRASLEELGLNEEQIEQFAFGGPAQTVTAWSSSGGKDWTESRLELEHVQSITITGDGGFWVFGHGERGPAVWTSPDGVSWNEESISGFDVDVTGLWEGKLIGLRHRGPFPELVFSSDGDDWESFGIEDLLPEDRFWNIGPTEIGPLGIAIVAFGHDESEMELGPEPVTLDKDGYTLTFDEMRGELTLERDGEEILDLFMHSEEIHEELDVDFGARTVAFLDPETLQPLVSFSFDELEEAQAMAYGGAVGEEEQVLLFSTDGETWSVQAFDEAFGPDAGFPMITITDEKVIAVVTEQAGGSDEELFDLAIWIAEP